MVEWWTYIYFDDFSNQFMTLLTNLYMNLTSVVHNFKSPNDFNRFAIFYQLVHDLPKLLVNLTCVSEFNIHITLWIGGGELSTHMFCC